ncbi:MAG: hypothetical protein MUD08_15785 [Cytophagales bacterium]|jgi:hypothetical protein|nr:hypothetical protein [Cytophagales bacterium]
MPAQQKKQALTRPSATLQEAQARLEKIFASIRTQKELDEISDVIVNYLSEKIDSETDVIVAEKSLQPADFVKIANTHIRRKKR